MQVYKSAELSKGDSWYSGFATRLRTADARRLAAMSLAWPDKSGEVPNPDRPSYNAMSVFWNDDRDQLRRLAASLTDLKTLADAHVGQSIGVFTKGSPDSLQAARGGLVSPVELQVGVVGQKSSTTPEGVLDYQYLARRVQDDKDKNLPRPSLMLSVGVGVASGVQSLSVSEYGTSEVAPLNGDSSVGVLEGTVTFSKEEGDYELFRRLTERHVIIGNAAVSGFVSRLAIYENGDARDNWRSLAPSSDEPLPDLAQVFPLAA